MEIKIMRAICLVGVLSIILLGCGNAKDNIPKIKNEKLGVELPANVHTDWEVEEDEFGKYVIFYSDPYASPYPPYKEGVSPDIEKFICIDNHESSPEDDKFVGTWVGGLNEYKRTNDGNYVPAEKYDRFEDQFFGGFIIEKEYDSGKYTVRDYECHINAGLEDRFNFSRGGYSRSVTAVEPHKRKVTVNGNILAIDYYDNGVKFAHLELTYHPENNTMELSKLDCDPMKRKLGGWFNQFGLRKHKDILKKYPSSNLGTDDLIAGLIQLKLDMIKKAHPEYREYKNLMLRNKHKKLIPGTKKEVPLDLHPTPIPYKYPEPDKNKK